jgi:hypothetical protein
MGLFTWVAIDNDLMPEEYNNFKGWQTKDVVEPFMETLKITKEGSLVYIETQRKWEPNEEHPLKGCFKKIGQTQTDLNYHGDMNFYTSDDKGKYFVDLVARFTEGQLQYIKKVELK